MSFTWTATDTPSYEPGVYNAKLVELEPMEGGIDNKGYVKWTFELTDEDYTGQTLRANSSTNFGPSSKARQWAENLLGRKLNPGDTVTPEDLIGREGVLSVSLQSTDRGTFARVDSVNPVRKKTQPQAQPSGNIDIDGEDIPF